MTTRSNDGCPEEGCPSQSRHLLDSDAIIKELEQTYENVLARKLATPEGLAYIKAKIAEIEGGPADPTATPVPEAAKSAPAKS